jgi:N6-L-threonylcarbamoyladenine synthase
MKILAIETSCDDTSVSVLETPSTVLSSIVSSQIDIHKEFGGVVPEIAARAHIKNMIPVLDEALNVANSKMDNIDIIATTKGPGLIGSLIVGVNTAKTLAYMYKKPLIAVHHTEGHIYANFLGKKPENQPQFPLVCLTASGGHTNIIYMKSHLDYEIVGDTEDDAAGEAFDKVAKMLGLGYPGGPIVSKLAQKGNPSAFNFPRVDLTKKPERNEEGFLVKAEESLDFSFSGLKTAVLREVKKLTTEGKALTEKQKNDICASFQEIATDILTRNLLRAVKKFEPKSVLLSGGVAANLLLREKIQLELKKIKCSASFFFPELEYCMDNAAMIGAVAYIRAQNNKFVTQGDLTPDPNLRLR